MELPERTLEPWLFDDEGEDDDDEYKVDSDVEADDSDSEEAEEHENALPPDEGEENRFVASAAEGRMVAAF
mgnify:CR=1 FL=1